MGETKRGSSLMAYQIEKECIICYACETVCTAEAINLKGSIFVIDPKLCTECDNSTEPKCIAICPEPGVINYKSN